MPFRQLGSGDYPLGLCSGSSSNLFLVLFILCVGGSALSETSAAFNTFSQHSIHQIFTKCLLCAQGTVLDPEDSAENKVNSVLQWEVGHIQIRYIKDSLDQGRNTSSPLLLSHYLQHSGGQNPHSSSLKRGGRGSVKRRKAPCRDLAHCSFLSFRQMGLEEVQMEN